MQLNEKQALAVHGIQRSSLICAGAGTGKTFCATEKVAYVQQHCRYPGILVLSFTRRATAEIYARIKDHRGVEVKTLCQFFYGILRQHGYKSWQLITDDRARTTLASLAIAKAGLTKKVDEAMLLTGMDTCRLDGDIKKAAAEYLLLLREARQLDFNAINFFLLELLQNNPAIAKKYQTRYKYLICDEAQDLNRTQFDIIRYLFPRKHNVTFVGDNRQSIMAWRGAEADVLERFREFYSADVYELDQNYRSTPEIIRLANEVQSDYTPLQPTRTSIEIRPLFYAAPDADAECTFIINTIRELVKSGSRLKDITILYRSMPAVINIAEKLLEAGDIPFVKVGCSFFRWSRPNFKELRSLLNLIDNPTPKEFLKCGKMFGLTDSAIRSIARCADLKEAGLADLLFRLIQSDSPDSFSEETGMVKDRLQYLNDLLAEDHRGLPLRNLICGLWDRVLKPYFDASDDMLLDDYLSASQQYAGLEEMLNRIRKMEKQIAAMTKLASKKDADFVTIESIHTAKGLEYPVVILCGANEGILPDCHEGTNLTEERNLAYTAVTRARNRLYISYAVRSVKTKEPAKPSRYFAKYFNGYNATQATTETKVAETK